jgi:hypothetical protein
MVVEKEQIQVENLAGEKVERRVAAKVENLVVKSVWELADWRVDK